MENLFRNSGKILHAVESQLGLIYVRVSTPEQDKEGYSIAAQLRLLREYAEKNDIKIVREIVEIESASRPGRPEFIQMEAFLKKNRSVRTVLAEKVDRLYRNKRDPLILEDLEVTIHFVKEGEVISKDSKASVKFIHDIRIALARQYSANLSEEVKKGLMEKARQGYYPGHAPYGYRHHNREIEIPPERAKIVRLVFVLYASGRYSLRALSKEVHRQTGLRLSKASLVTILRNEFYIGYFWWGGCRFEHRHARIIIEAGLFERVQVVLNGNSRPKHSKHHQAFRRLLTCAHCGCVVTAEIAKGKYTYYRCTGHRGKCALPRFRERDLAERLAELLQAILIPEEIAKQIEEAMNAEQSQLRARSERERVNLQRELARVRSRVDSAYKDKLDGTISEEFWSRIQSEWASEERRIQGLIDEMESKKIDARFIDTARILELAQRAYFLYLRREPVEQAELLKKVALNCSIDAVNLYPTYRKPFDLFAKHVKTEEWSTWPVIKSRRFRAPMVWTRPTGLPMLNT